MTVSPARRGRRPVRIRTRLVLVLAVPALLLIAGMAVEGSGRLHARSDAAEVAGHVTLVLAVQDLVHALQHERSLLTALLAGEARVRADLPPAREATDRAGAALSSLLAALPPTSYAPVREALARLPALDRARTATPALAADPDAPATPGGPPPRAPQPTLAPMAPLPGPFGALVSPGTSVAGPPPLPQGPLNPITNPSAHPRVPQRAHSAGAVAGTSPDRSPPTAVPRHAAPPNLTTATPVPRSRRAGGGPQEDQRVDSRTPTTSPLHTHALHPITTRAGQPPTIGSRHARGTGTAATGGALSGEAGRAAGAMSADHRTSRPGDTGPGRPAPTTVPQRARGTRVATTTAGSPPGGAGRAGTAGAAGEHRTAGRRGNAPAALPGDLWTAGRPGNAPAGQPSDLWTAGRPGDVRAGLSGDQPRPVDRGPVVRREVFEAFTDVIEELADGAFATQAGRGDPSLLRRLQALEAVSRAKEAAARERAVVTAAFATGAFTRSEYVTFLEARASMADGLAGFRRTATPEGVAELARALRGAQAARTAKLERRALAASPGTPLTARTRTWLAASSAYVDALRTVQRSAGHDLRARAVETGDRHTRHLAWLAGLGAMSLLGMVGLGALMVRSVTRPLRRITGEATALASHIAVLEAAETTRPTVPDSAEEEAAHLWRAYDASLLPRPGNDRKLPYGREARGEGHHAEKPAYGGGSRHLGERFPDGSAGRPCGAGEASGRARTTSYEREFGRLAGALGDVHEAAVRIAAGRAAIRRDAADSLGGLGTRHRDLVHRQLAFISALQRNESDPAVLARLCELDRVTSRLRRNAESLLVLTGRRGNRRSSEPVPVDEVLRSVLAEIEDHHRVVLRVAGRAQVRGPVVAEVAHLLAELVENALGYSPPDTQVDVLSRAAEGECRVTISDYGVGMTAGELATANARLRGEQSFLVAPTRCLGHHVVGRLAERLGVRVSLHASPGRGVTALVVLPEELLAARPAELLKDSR